MQASRLWFVPPAQRHIVISPQVRRDLLVADSHMMRRRRVLTVKLSNGKSEKVVHILLCKAFVNAYEEEA